MNTRDLVKILQANPDIIVADGVISYALDENGKTVAVSPSGLRLPKLTEHDMQTAIIEECDRRAIANPEWGMVVAVPNGQYRHGQRMEPGLRPGFPDLIVTVARHSRIGLGLELKVSPNKPSANQLAWHRKLILQNWIVEVIYDNPQAAIDKIQWFLEG